MNANTEKLTKEQAINLIAGIANTLELIPINGRQNTSLMEGIYRALDNLAKWAQGVPADVLEEGA